AEDNEKELVSLLDKALYGMMDAANNWWGTLDVDMTRLGYKRSEADQSVRSREQNGERTITSTYTDDTSGMSSSEEEAVRARKELGEKYEVKDLVLDQEEYLRRTLEKFGMADCTPKYTPLPSGVILSRSQAPSTEEDHHYMRDKPFKEVLGSLMYAQIRTRPDISFAITSLSRFMSNPGKPHWLALQHVMRYIKATLHYRLRYGGEGYQDYMPQGYYDSDYAADIDTRKSVSGGVYLQAGGPTSWSSKFQDTVSTSTTEAEYIALAKAGEQIQWMYSALTEIGMVVHYPAELKGDNNGSISIAENKRNHNRVKHIDVRHHFICHAVKEGRVSISYVPSTENLVDIFTKQLARPQHHKFCVAMCLVEN
ncbi:Copia protein, partial [Termitomyces sp. T112]